ncbi:MAG TPA: RDD family protein [Terriglobales bacterium]|nr:RDD family protein [Terriglobales bacterium]
MEQQSSSAEPASAPSEQPEGIWRNEVQARVAGYRTRRGRRIEGAFSMRFPFPPEETASQACDVAAPRSGEALALAQDDAAVESLAPSTAVSDTPGPELSPGSAELGIARESPPGAHEPFAPLPAPRRSRKVIAFPRPIPDPADYEDAFLSEQPRILEALQEFPATPLLDGLRFPGQEQQAAAAPADHLELPLQAVSLGPRIYAGLLDCAVVASAAGTFAAASWWFLPKLSLSKPLLLVLAALPFLLWAAYQYLFVVYSGRTVGMRAAKIRLSSFKGGTPGWGQRRVRAISFYFAAASLMMGLFWALVDVDRLCWHDRISRTYLVKA